MEVYHHQEQVQVRSSSSVRILFPKSRPVPVPPQQQQQVRGPTISENVLNNNPDFQFSRGGQQQKRRVNPGFVPVAAEI